MFSFPLSCVLGCLIGVIVLSMQNVHGAETTQTTTTTITSVPTQDGVQIVETVDTKPIQPGLFRQKVDAVTASLNRGKENVVAVADKLSGGRYTATRDRVISTANGVVKYLREKKDGMPMFRRKELPDMAMACTPPQQPQQITMGEKPVQLNTNTITMDEKPLQLNTDTVTSVNGIPSSTNPIIMDETHVPELNSMQM